MIVIYLIASMSCVAIAIVVFWGYARYASWDMERLASLEKWSDEYFRNATIFSASEKTPTVLLKDIVALNHSLNDHWAWRKLYSGLKSVPVARINADRHTEIFEFLLRENLTNVYRDMAEAYIFTISFKDRVKGPQIRKLLASADVLDKKKITSENSEFFVGALLMNPLIFKRADFGTFWPFGSRIRWTK